MAVLKIKSDSGGALRWCLGTTQFFKEAQKEPLIFREYLQLLNGFEKVWALLNQYSYRNHWVLTDMYLDYRTRANKGRRHYSKIMFLGLRLPYNIT